MSFAIVRNIICCLQITRLVGVRPGAPLTSAKTVPSERINLGQGACDGWAYEHTQTAANLAGRHGALLDWQEEQWP